MISRVLPGRSPARMPSSRGPGYLIRTASKSFSSALGAMLSEHGVALNHYYYLRALYEHNGLTPAELSTRIRMERATVTTVLDTMEHQGLVQRARHQVDRRKIQVFLTPKGEALREAVIGCIDAVNARALGDIPVDEFERFCATLQKFVTNLEPDRQGELHAVG